MSRKFKVKTMDRLSPVAFSEQVYWWVERAYDRDGHPVLAYHDGRRVGKDTVHRIPFTSLSISPCHYGMHASRKLSDAMKHAEGCTRGVWVVALGSFDEHQLKPAKDKTVAAARTYLHRASFEIDILPWIELRAYDVLSECFQGTRQRKDMLFAVTSLSSWIDRLQALRTMLLTLRNDTPVRTLVGDAIRILENVRDYKSRPEYAVREAISILSRMRARMRVIRKAGASPWSRSLALSGISTIPFPTYEAQRRHAWADLEARILQRAGL